MLSCVLDALNLTWQIIREEDNMDEDTCDYINFTPKKYKDLQVTYNKAVDDKKEVFVFNSKQFFIGYAKYLLQYLETKFKKDGIK